VVAEPSYILGQAIDFTSEIMKIKRANAEYVILGSSVGDVASFLREAKNQGLKAIIFGGSAPASERKIIFQAEDAAENYISTFATSMFRETQVPGGANLNQETYIKALEATKYNGEGLGPEIRLSPEKRYSSNSTFLGQVDMKMKDYKRITDWMAPPQELIDKILK
jgi:ABC-type branched-subunit amino acid transport system substrate-binding protein